MGLTHKCPWCGRAWNEHAPVLSVTDGGMEVRRLCNGAEVLTVPTRRPRCPSCGVRMVQGLNRGGEALYTCMASGCPNRRTYRRDGKVAR